MDKDSHPPKEAASDRLKRACIDVAAKLLVFTWITEVFFDVGAEIITQKTLMALGGVLVFVWLCDTLDKLPLSFKAWKRPFS